MTQAHVLPWHVYTANGVQTSFPYSFRVGLTSDLVVYDNGSVTTGYAVTGVGQAEGGEVVFVEAPAPDHVLFMVRQTPVTQLVDYINNDPFGAETHEGALDKLTRLIQDLHEVLSRIPQLVPTTVAALRNLALPAPGAGKVLGWNSLGTGLQLYEYATALQTVPGHAFGVSSVTVPAVDAAGALLAAGLIPAGVRCSKVVYQCTVGFGTSRGLTSLSVGDAALVDRWGGALGITLGTTSGYGYGLVGDVETGTALDVIVTANGGPFDGTGACKLYALWQQPVLA